MPRIGLWLCSMPVRVSNTGHIPHIYALSCDSAAPAGTDENLPCWVVTESSQAVLHATSIILQSASGAQKSDTDSGYISGMHASFQTLRDYFCILLLILPCSCIFVFAQRITSRWQIDQMLMPQRTFHESTLSFAQTSVLLICRQQCSPRRWVQRCKRCLY